jgi:hypothetical protein
MKLKGLVVYSVYNTCVPAAFKLVLFHHVRLGHEEL